MGVWLLIAGYIIVAGIIAAAWDERHRYDKRWYDDIGATLLVILWIIIVPLSFLYIVGRIITYIFLAITDRLFRPRRRRRR